MPTYMVKRAGIHKDVMYDPDGKRPTITVDKPFGKGNPKPSWIGDVVKPAARKTAKKQTNVSGGKGSSKKASKSTRTSKVPRVKK